MITRVRRLTVAFSTLFLVLTPLTLAPTATASAIVNEYPMSGYMSRSITSGPDGALWVGASGNSGGITANSYVFQVTTSGNMTPYEVAGESNTNGGYDYPASITTGPDNNLWYTLPGGGYGFIGNITTSGSATKYGFGSSNPQPTGITVGPDSNLWFTENGAIDSISPSGTFGTYYPLPSGVHFPQNIVTGPDNNLWFTVGNSNAIYSLTTSGAFTAHPTSSPANDIIKGPDGALWFTETSGNKIGRFDITGSGSLNEYSVPTPSSNPIGITTGPDGAVWFTEYAGNKIGRIDTTTSSITEYTLPSTANGPRYITTGSDGNLWFTDNNGVGQLNPIITIPSAPVLSAPSPVQYPYLTWNSVPGADSYNIYRNGTKVDSTTNTTYTDNIAPEGTDAYSVTAVNTAGESTQSNSVSVIVDRTAPTISNITLATDPLPVNQTTSLSASVADNLSGVAYAEYYTGTDPGQGNGTAMTMSNGTATATVGNYTSPGMYTFYVRDEDNAGNWSSPMSVTLDVYNPAGGYTAGHGSVVPSSSTSNPGDTLPTETGNNVTAHFDFTLKYASSTSTTPTGTSTFTWGSTCNNPHANCFSVMTDNTVTPAIGSLAWLIVPGDNTATFQGTASVSQGSTNLGTNYPVRISVTGTTTTTPGHYLLQVYAVGANPDTATPLYQASGDLSGGAVVLHP